MLTAAESICKPMVSKLFVSSCAYNILYCAFALNNNFFLTLLLKVRQVFSLQRSIFVYTGNLCIFYDLLIMLFIVTFPWDRISMFRLCKICYSVAWNWIYYLLGYNILGSNMMLIIVPKYIVTITFNRTSLTLVLLLFINVSFLCVLGMKWILRSSL